VDPWGLDRECSGGGKSKPDFYVGPDGPSATMPSTAYRYVRYLNDDGSLNQWAPDLIKNKNAPVTYFGFDKFETGKAARDGFQIKGPDKVDPTLPADVSWSDARLRGTFDTLQLYENGRPQVRHPRMFGDEAGAPLEPFTAAYPEYGKGGVQQMHADKRKIYFDEIDILPEE
ncbi:type IV secretion protein Rhs, partial [Cronobacter dublinensis]|nr:type IV secretion protein Rhs [Cronobacter dublinensis]